MARQGIGVAGHRRASHLDSVATKYRYPPLVPVHRQVLVYKSQASPPSPTPPPLLHPATTLTVESGDEMTSKERKELAPQSPAGWSPVCTFSWLATTPYKSDSLSSLSSHCESPRGGKKRKEKKITQGIERKGHRLP